MLTNHPGNCKLDPVPHYICYTHTGAVWDIALKSRIGKEIMADREGNGRLSTSSPTFSFNWYCFFQLLN